MKNLKYAICLIGLVTLGDSFGGQGFQGVDFSLGSLASKYKVGGAEIYKAGVDQGYSTLDSNQNKAGAMLGVSYGFGSKKFVTTVGIDYVNSTSNMPTAIKTNGVAQPMTTGPITQILQNRYEAYVAPGYKLTNSTLGYVKLGVLDIPTKPPIDSSGSDTTLTGGPKSIGALYGIGVKQKFSTNSPYFIKLEYTGGQTKLGQTQDALSNSYQSKINFTSASASIGLSF
jgi:hypothetical protein